MHTAYIQGASTQGGVLGRISRDHLYPHSYCDTLRSTTRGLTIAEQPLNLLTSHTTSFQLNPRNYPDLAAVSTISPNKP